MHRMLGAEGVAVVQVLFQDAQGQPATTLFCETWVQTFDLTLPVFVDPPGNSLVYFDQAVTPLNLIIDGRGRVLWSMVGSVPPDLETVLRSFL